MRYAPRPAGSSQILPRPALRGPGATFPVCGRRGPAQRPRGRERRERASPQVRTARGPPARQGSLPPRRHGKQRKRAGKRAPRPEAGPQPPSRHSGAPCCLGQPPPRPRAAPGQGLWRRPPSAPQLLPQRGAEVPRGEGRSPRAAAQGEFCPPFPRCCLEGKSPAGAAPRSQPLPLRYSE